MLLNYLLFISNDLFFSKCTLSAQPSHVCYQQLMIWTAKFNLEEFVRWGQNYCREFGKKSLMIMLQTSKNEYSKVHRKTDTDSLFLSLTPIYSPCLLPSVFKTLGPLREIYCGLTGFLKSFLAPPSTIAKYGTPPHSKLSAYCLWCDLAMWKVAAEHQGRVESLVSTATRKLVRTSKAYAV